MKANLTKSAFREWLRGFEPDAVIGIPNDSKACPIANYLRSALGTDTVRVWEDYYTFFDENQGKSNEYSLPKWASRFIQKTDKLFDLGILAQLAVEILG